MLLVFLISLFGLVIIGVPISFSLVGTGFCMMAVKAMGNPRFWSLFTLTQKFTNGVDSVPLLAIPFFMIAGEIMSRLYWGRPPPEWPSFAFAAGGAPPGRPSPFRPPPATDRVMILSPAPQNYRLPPGQETLTLDLLCSERGVYWFWNGTGVGSAPDSAPLSVPFPAGRHRVVAVPSDPARLEVAVSFIVSRSDD